MNWGSYRSASTQKSQLDTQPPIQSQKKSANIGDFHQRQLFFQSVNKSILPPKPLKSNFQNDINLKQVERRPFGVINERQQERMSQTNGIDGVQKGFSMRQPSQSSLSSKNSANSNENQHFAMRKQYSHTKNTDLKGVISYDSALQYRRENVPEKINTVKKDSYHKPQEYIARNITYQMNKEKMFGVNWKHGDDSSNKAQLNRRQNSIW
eukprot:403355052